MISSSSNVSKASLSDDKAYLKVINEFATGLLHQSTVDDILWNVVYNTIANLGFSDCVIYLLDAEGEFLIKKAASSDESNQDTNGVSKLRLGEGIVGNVGLKLEPRIINDTTHDPDYVVDEVRRLSEISVPIVYENKLMGVIDSEHAEKNYYNEVHLELLTTVASMTAVKIAQAGYFEKLQLRQKQLDLIHENSNDLIFLVELELDGSFRYISVNKAYLGGIGLDRDTIIGKTIDEVWDQNMTNFFTDKYNTAIQLKCPITYEVNHTVKSNDIYVETTITPIFNEGDKCTYISGVSRDITEQKATQKQLIQSKELFENLFELSPSAILIHDYKKITSVNKAFLRLFRYKDKNEILGMPPLETIVYEKDVKIVHFARWQCKNEPVTPIPEIRLKRGDDTIFIAEAYVTSITINDVSHIRVTAFDITDRKQAESILLESEKMYRSLFENSLDGIYKTTPSGRFVDANMAMVKMLGYDSKEELLAIDINKDLYFKEEDRQVYDLPEVDVFRLKKKDGTEVWVEDHGYHEYDDFGNIIFNHGILRDVTLSLIHI